MTERLYYTDSMLFEFEAHVVSVERRSGATAVTMDRSAFYPTSGGQPFDTGWLERTDDGTRLRVKDVVEDEDSGEVLHFVEAGADRLTPGTIVRGMIDAERRHDHMQQHSGQHVLSAAFERLYDFPTVSFHLGEESCTIDLAASSVKAQQLAAVEKLVNEVIAENRPVLVRFVTPDEARTMGVRKIPSAERAMLRLVHIRDFDLNACGGTHVQSTGQIGAILLHKTEKVKQGVRVEFVCGLRAIATARGDFETLVEAAALFSTHIREVPQQIRKSLEESKAARKLQQRVLEEMAELLAQQMLREARVNHVGGEQLITHFFADRDVTFLKLLGQKLTKEGEVVALLACGGVQPSLVFAQSPGLTHDMGSLMKQMMQEMGTRGGGSRDMAQGGAPDSVLAEQALLKAANAIG